jgi:hypothetical protein
MDGREKPHMVKYKAITNDWNYDARCTLHHFQFVWFLMEVDQVVIIYSARTFGNTVGHYQVFIDFKKAYDSFTREVLYSILIEICVSMKLN